MFPEKEKTYPGRKFIQALQVGLVFAIAVFSFMALTRPRNIEPDTPPALRVTDAWPSETRRIETVPTAAPSTMLEDSAYDLYLRGKTQHDLNNYAIAIDLYTAALELDSTMTDAWLSRAVAYAESGTNERTSRNDFWRYLQGIETDRLEHLINVSETLQLEMTEGRVYALTFDAQEGDVVTVTAKSVENGEPGDVDVVDPLVLLFNSDDVLLQADDDTLRSDGSLINMNSRIDDYTVTQGGTYTLLVGHAGGGSYGLIDVKLIVR